MNYPLELKPCPNCNSMNRDLIFVRKGLIVGNGFEGAKCKDCGFHVKERSIMITIKTWNSFYDTEGDL